MTPSFSVRAKILGYFAGLALIVAALGISLWQFSGTRSRVFAAEVQHDTLTALASSLRQSSNDLSRMARTYVATGDSTFAHHFEDVLAIREGRAPRPADYEYAFWRPRALIEPDSRAGGSRTSLPAVLRQFSLTDQERTLLDTAEHRALQLIAVERTAISLARGIRTDTTQQTAVSRVTPEPVRARAMLYDTTYSRVKLSALQAYSQLVRTIDRRTTADMRAERERQHALMNWSLGIMGLLVLYGFLGVWLFSRSISSPLGSLLTTVRTDAPESVHGASDGEIEALSMIYDNLVQQLREKIAALEDTRGQLETRSDELAVANDTLAARTTLLDATLANMPQGVIVLDHELKSVAWNDRLFQLLGFPDTLAQVGTSAHAFLESLNERRVMGKDTAEELAKYFEQATRGGPFMFEMALENGITLEARGNSVENGLLIASFTDITDRRAGERELRHTASYLEAVLANAIDPILTFNEAGLIESFNPAAEQVFGYSANEVLNRSVMTLLPEPHRTEYTGYLRHYLATRQRTVMGQLRELEGLRRNGSVFPIEISINEFMLDDRRLFVGVVRNISERKVVERMKNEFVSTVSHELRTPLTSIAGSLGLLSASRAGELPDKAKKLIDIAHSNSQRLVRLINDILDLEKLDSGKMVFAFEPLSLRQVAEQGVEANRGYAEEYGVTIELDPSSSDATVVADHDRLMQIVSNLVSNACKFSHPGAVVTVAVRRRSDSVRLSVQDQGPGIPPEFRKVIFNRFSQADGSDHRQRGGTGLGLSIVKSIVTRLGGRVSFETTMGVGTTFFVDLPLAPAEVATDGAPEPVFLPGVREQLEMAAEAGGAVARVWPLVLHVEDDVDVQNVVKASLEGIADIVPAGTLADARAALAYGSYDLVILDVRLPDGSGLDLLPIPPRVSGEPVPVIIFSVEETGTVTPYQVVAALTKSRVSLDDLARRVRSAIASQQFESPTLGSHG